MNSNELDDIKVREFFQQPHHPQVVRELVGDLFDDDATFLELRKEVLRMREETRRLNVARLNRLFDES